MKLSGREAVLAWGAVVVLTLGATWWLGQPALKEWKDFAGQRDALDRRQRSAARLLEDQPEVEQRLADLRKQLPSYPVGRDVTAELMRILERTARDHRLNLLRREPEREKSAGELFEVAIQCTWEGDLEGVVRFLYALQNQSVILDIRQLTVNPSPGQPGRLRGTFTLDCAYSREPAAAATEGSPES